MYKIPGDSGSIRRPAGAGIKIETLGKRRSGYVSL